MSDGCLEAIAYVLPAPVADRVTADRILSGAHRLLDPDEPSDRSGLARACLESLVAEAGLTPPAEMAEQAGRPLVLMAGERFGLGTRLPVTVGALRAAGCCAVVARSFDRTFLRLAVNHAFVVPLRCDEPLPIDHGGVCRLDLDAMTLDGVRLGPLGAMKDVLDAGGLINAVKSRVDPGR
jgi:3-isopropylmalate dehydratase small subunit